MAEAFWVVILVSALIGAGISGFFCSWLAGTKGRETEKWFWIGFFFGPIALFAIGFAPSLQSSSDCRVENSGASSPLPLEKICPRCDERIKFKALICRYCGHEYGEENVARSVKEHLEAMKADAVRAKANMDDAQSKAESQRRKEWIEYDLTSDSRLLNYMRGWCFGFSYRGDDEYLVEYIRSGACVNYRSLVLRLTPLHIAAGNGVEAVVKALLERGADVDAIDLFGKSPLDYAISSENSVAMDVLKTAGARLGKDLADELRRENERNAEFIVTACDGCGKEMKVPAIHVGKFGTCNSCGKRMQVRRPPQKVSEVLTSWKILSIIAVLLSGIFIFNLSSFVFRIPTQSPVQTAKKHNDIGMKLYNSSAFPEALAQFEMAHKFAPDNEDIQRNLYNSYEEVAQELVAVNRIQAAVEHLKLAIALEPENTSAMVQIASCYLTEGQVSNAIAYLERAIDLEPENADAHYLLGDAYSRNGLSLSAQAQWKYVLEVMPDWPGLREKYDKLFSENPVVTELPSKEAVPDPLPISDVTFEGIVAAYESIGALRSRGTELTSAQIAASLIQEKEEKSSLEGSLVGLRVRWLGWVSDVSANYSDFRFHNNESRSNNSDIARSTGKQSYEVKITMYAPQVKNEGFGASVEDTGNNVFFTINGEEALRIVQYQRVSVEGTISSVENGYDIAEQNGYYEDLEYGMMGEVQGRNYTIWSTRIGLKDVVYSMH